MHTLTHSLLAALAVLALATSSAAASGSIPTVANPYLNDIAMATIDSWGNPVILYNPSLMASYSPATQRFFIAHEHAHHASGHVYAAATAGAWMRQGMELEADCTAATYLASIGDREAVRAGAEALAMQGPYASDMLHPAGADRARTILSCGGGW